VLGGKDVALMLVDVLVDAIATDAASYYILASLCYPLPHEELAMTTASHGQSQQNQSAPQSGASGLSGLSETEKVSAIRAELPVTGRYVYLNAGTNGPL